MSKTEGMITMATLLEHLQEQGYDPQEPFGHTGDWYDLVASGIGSVRVCVYPDDGGVVEVYFFDGGLICEWDAALSPGTPDAVVIATIEAAERQLADRRGGPVTPAQAEAAR
jgi:hypothetical protein